MHEELIPENLIDPERELNHIFGPIGFDKVDSAKLYLVKSDGKSSKKTEQKIF